jgi:DNA-directed RNA polymerase specialized sigma24 family protein
VISPCERHPETGVPAKQLASSDLLLVLRRCEAAAARFVGRFALPSHERDDIRQELLLDVLNRIKAFDPRRGSLGAFVGTLIAHRTAELARQLYRQRAVESPPWDPPAPRECDSGGDAEAGTEVGADDELELTHLRLDLERSLSSISSADLALCRQLIEYAPTEISRSERLSRASIYRRIKGIRTHLLMVGFATAT